MSAVLLSRFVRDLRVEPGRYAHFAHSRQCGGRTLRNQGTKQIRGRGRLGGLLLRGSHGSAWYLDD